MTDRSDLETSTAQHVAGGIRGLSVAINDVESHFQRSSPVSVASTATDQSERTKSQPFGPSPKPGSMEAVPYKPPRRSFAQRAL